MTESTKTTPMQVDEVGTGERERVFVHHSEDVQPSIRLEMRVTYIL
jgi:hypothetical protein